MSVWLELGCLVLLYVSTESHDDLYRGTVSKHFTWGCATSAYQVEGAWNSDGKTPHIWDVFTHKNNGKNIKDHHNGDDSCKSYTHYDEDVKRLKEIGVNHYRFSISWSRILPIPTNYNPNPLGLKYYKSLISELKRNGIEPMITMFHWDLPQLLEDYGSWANDSIIDHFKAYADVLFRELGNDVKYWITFNEPFVISWAGYGAGNFAPGIKEPATLPYRVTHNIIKSHTEVWHLYNDKYKQRQKGMLGIAIDIDFFIPKDPSNRNDVDAAERQEQFMGGWYINPLLGNGDYPAIMKTYIARKSKEANLTKSRLPEFSNAEKARNKGSADFLGLNHYTTRLVEHSDNGISNPGYDGDSDTKQSVDPTWPTSASSFLYVYPPGMRGMLKWIKNTYNNPTVIVTENGVSDHTGTLDDQPRIDYLKAYINELIKAIHLDGCNVVGYTVWSVLDNFEWRSGYTEKFGLNYVNFSDPNRPRIPKKSASFYKKLISDQGFPKTSGAARLLGSAWCGVLVFLLMAYWRYQE